MEIISKGDSAAGAMFSPCERYRYRWWRVWSELGTPRLAHFIMLNPSTATHELMDPTVTRCKGFAEEWGYGGVIVSNIFAYRATDPKVMRAQEDPVGPMNDSFIVGDATKIVRTDGVVVCAWSQHGKFKGRGAEVRSLLWRNDIPMHYLKMGAGGMPHHPLYLKGDIKPQRWV
jgi:hypothetical protein